MAQGAGDGVGVGVEADQLHAPLHQDAAAGQVVAQHLFGLGLGDEQQERIGGVVQAEPEQPDADDAAAGVELDPDRVVAPLDQLLGQPQPRRTSRVRGWTPNARLVHLGPAAGRRCERRPERPQLGGQGEAGRSGPDDQDVEQVAVGGCHVRAARVARQRWAARPA